MLIVVGMLMTRAADPRNWVWLTGQAQENAIATEPVAAAVPVQPEEIVPGPTDADVAELAAAREQFQALTDYTLALSREEMPAYWRLFAWGEHQSLADLEGRADRSAVLNQFMQSPDEQRGKLFQLKLNVRRVLSYDAPANSAGIGRVYEVWGWTTESKAWLYVVLTAHLPPGMPVGPDVNEQVTFAGYFLKVQGYQAAGAGPQDKPLAAPLLIGRMASTAPPKPVAVAADGGWTQGMALLVLLLGAIGLAIWIFIPKGTASQWTESSLGQTALPRGEVRDWLAQAERGSSSAQESELDFRFHNN